VDLNTAGGLILYFVLAGAISVGVSAFVLAALVMIYPDGPPSWWPWK